MVQVNKNREFVTINEMGNSTTRNETTDNILSSLYKCLSPPFSLFFLIVKMVDVRCYCHEPKVQKEDVMLFPWDNDNFSLCLDTFYPSKRQINHSVFNSSPLRQQWNNNDDDGQEDEKRIIKMGPIIQNRQIDRYMIFMRLMIIIIIIVLAMITVLIAA